jgi:hypothetical protein
MALLGADVDGDCQDDAVFLPAALWTRAADGAFADLPGAFAADGLAVASADLDGDGNQDLVVAGGNAAHVLLGDGAGHFREQPSAFDVAPTDATAVAVGDLDGDGNPDIIIGQGSASPAASRVYLNDRMGSGHFAFASAALPPRAERATAIAVADVDADGDLDLVIAHADAPVRLYLNRGNAFLEDRSFVGRPDQEAAAVPSLLLTDLDLDCLPDLIVPRAGAAPLVWLNRGGGMFATGPALDGADESRAVASDDLDGDGLPELVLAGASGVTVLGQSR